MSALERWRALPATVRDDVLQHVANEGNSYSQSGIVWRRKAKTEAWRSETWSASCFQNAELCVTRCAAYDTLAALLREVAP